MAKARQRPLEGRAGCRRQRPARMSEIMKMQVWQAATGSRFGEAEHMRRDRRERPRRGGRELDNPERGQRSRLEPQQARWPPTQGAGLTRRLRLQRCMTWNKRSTHIGADYYKL